MMTRQRWIGVFMVVGMAWFLGIGCSSGPEEPPASRTTQDIRGDSDRFFQKMEREEEKKN